MRNAQAQRPGLSAQMYMQVPTVLSSLNVALLKMMAYEVTLLESLVLMLALVVMEALGRPLNQGPDPILGTMRAPWLFLLPTLKLAMMLEQGLTLEALLPHKVRDLCPMSVVSVQSVQIVIVVIDCTLLLHAL